MFSKIKSLFQDRCPECEQKLVSHYDNMSLTKHCPDHHYTEETYGHLGVTIVYKSDRQDN